MIEIGSVATVRAPWRARTDRKSTRLNSSHSQISYGVFCLKKKRGGGSGGVFHGRTRGAGTRERPRRARARVCLRWFQGGGRRPRQLCGGRCAVGGCSERRA